MTSEGNGDAADKLLIGMVRDADEYFARLKAQHKNQTRVHVAVIGSVVWFAVFVALGLAAPISPSWPAFWTYSMRMASP